MRVSPSQLVPDCILLRDVLGKTNRPIIPKKTVLTKEHIKLLDKFLVEHVDVSERLLDGKIFKPKPLEKEEELATVNEEVQVNSLSFKEHYLYVVDQYRKLFETWQHNVPVDMVTIRNLIVPLINRMDDIGSAIYTLHNYTNKKDYFYHHSVSVAIISAFLGKKMGYNQGEWMQIGIAGLLFDAGMAKLSPSLLNKVGPLTEKERSDINKHPTYSYRLLEHNPSVTLGIKLAVLQHHERIDGSGYPLGLSQEKIHAFSRIIAVCDIYHAMTSERLYKEKQSPFKVIEELQREQYTKLDLMVVQTFIESISNFSIGSKVCLSNNQVGEIVFMEAKQPTRPMVRLDGSGDIISLSNHQSLYIQEILPTR